jgi:hypothetical protein
MTEIFEQIQILELIPGAKIPQVIKYSEEVQAEAELELGEKPFSYILLDEASFQLYAEVPMIPGFDAVKLIKYFTIYGIPGDKRELPSNLLFKLQDRRFYMTDKHNIYEI